MNHRFLKALRREPVDRTPVWVMRQAGRYLPEYRRVRSQAGDFLTLCKTPELACEVTMQPLTRFALDAAILFSDILTIPDAMGLGLTIDEGVGPRFQKCVTSHADVESLHNPDPEGELRYVMDAVRLITRELDDAVPLIGFAGSPWTLATYMVEGGGSRDFRISRALTHRDASLAHKLLEKLTGSITDYLAAQAAAGASALMIFDTWGGVLSPRSYQEFSLSYMTRIVSALQNDHGIAKPIILFTKGGGAWLEDMAASGCQALGIDWSTSLGNARRRVGDQVALQGNMDPAVLLSEPGSISREVIAVLDDYGHGPGHVFNLGHGITPDVDPENLAVAIETLHQESPKYHQASSASSVTGTV